MHCFTGRVTTTVILPSLPAVRSARALPLPPTTPTRYAFRLAMRDCDFADFIRRTLPTSLRPSLLRPTRSASVSLSTSPSSTMRSSTRPTALAISPSRPSTTPLPSSTASARSPTATAPSSCSSCATTLPSGPHPTALSQRLVLRATARPRRRPRRPRRRLPPPPRVRLRRLLKRVTLHSRAFQRCVLRPGRPYMRRHLHACG